MTGPFDAVRSLYQRCTFPISANGLPGSNGCGVSAPGDSVIFRKVTMTHHLTRVLANVAEALAIEILSEFTEEDYAMLSIKPLQDAAQVLEEAGVMVPFTVQEALRLQRKARTFA